MATVGSAWPAPGGIELLMSRKRTEEEPLRGWRDIAGFLGQSVGTAQRWGKEGMPVRHQGRYVTASREELSRWLGRESGTAEPVEIAAGADAILLPA